MALRNDVSWLVRLCDAGRPSDLEGGKKLVDAVVALCADLKVEELLKLKETIVKEMTSAAVTQYLEAPRKKNRIN